MSRGSGLPDTGRALRVALTGAAVAALAGCGVVPDRGPQALPTGDVPFGLLQATPAPSASSEPAEATVRVFFLRGQRLVAVRRTAPYPGRPDQAVRALLDGVSSEQSDAGLRSAIPDGTSLLAFDLQDEVATLDLSSQFASIRSGEQVLAVAQLVYTATSSARVRQVKLAVAGRPVEVPRPDGSLTGAPVGRSDYARLLRRG